LPPIGVVWSPGRRGAARNTELVEKPTRRGVMIAGAGALLTACGGGPGRSQADAGSSAATPSSPAAPQPSSSTSPILPELPDVTTWHPDPGDLSPIAKLTAVRRVEAAGSGAGHAIQVVDAQYGGLLTDSASVLVVTRSWHRRGPRLVDGGHTYDVRLSRTPTGWRITEVRPSRPGPPASMHSAAARRVLTSRRISLPPAGRADVLSGQVHDSVLQAMLAMSATHRIDVSVVRSGHPLHVFGTDRLSDHPQGRAFDTWAIDGHMVVDPRTSRALVEDYMHAAAQAGSYNVGGPYLLGAAPQWFSDATHHDHVHAGFTT
jgi:hypothetical protein